MKRLEQLKLNIAYYSLDKELKRISRSPVVTNISKAESIGIIFNATYSFTFDMVKEFAEELMQNRKSIHCLGYVHSTELIDHYLFRKGFDFFTRKSLNWYYKPIDDTTVNFINQEFDILIDLGLEEYFPIHYITALSKAKFKVGKKMPDRNYDNMMLDIEKENTLRYQIRKEVEQEKEEKNEKSEFEREADRKSDYESELQYLITHIKHYLSIIK